MLHFAVGKLQETSPPQCTTENVEEPEFRKGLFNQKIYGGRNAKSFFLKTLAISSSILIELQNHSIKFFLIPS